ASRTRRAISWVYCAPKSTMSTLSGWSVMALVSECRPSRQWPWHSDIRTPYRDAFQRPGFALVLLPSYKEHSQSAEGPRPTAANGQPSGAPLGGDIAALSTAYPYRALRTERSYGLGTSTQGVWFENPRGPIALLLPAAAGVPVSFRRLPQAPRPSSRDT